MGIKGIKKLINDHKQTISLIDISSIIVDSSLFMHKAKNAENTYGIKYLSYFKNQIKLFKKNKVIMLYVFDGPCSELKEKEKLKRKDKSDVRVTSEDVLELKKLLNEHDIEYIVSETEADSMCVKLMKERNADGVLTEDTDILCYDGILLSGYKSNIKNLIKYDIKHILENLELSLDDYIKLCIICGCDYTNGIRGVSVKKGMVLIKEGVTEEYLCSNIENYKGAMDIFTLKNTNENSL